MTENTEEAEEVEQMYEMPEYRNAEGKGDFLEGAVGAFLEYGEQAGDDLKYGNYYISAEALDNLSHIDEDARIQITVVQHEDQTDTCGDCGEEFYSVAKHQALSECGDE